MKKLIFIIAFMLAGITSFSQVIEPFVTADKVQLDSLNTDSLYGYFWLDGTDLKIYHTSTWNAVGAGGGGASLWNGIKADSVWSDSTADVGIGTADPQYKLHTNGTGYFSGNLYSNSDFYVGGQKVFRVGGNRVNMGYALEMRFGRDNGYKFVSIWTESTAAIHILNSTVKGIWQWDGKMRIGDATTPTKMLEVFGDAEVTSNIYAGDSIFADKAVGIGTTSPQEKLDVGYASGVFLRSFRGTTDTDITGWITTNANGDTCYCYPNAAGNGITVSTTKP